MSSAYEYELRVCDVPDERKPELHSFRQKRAQWTNWLDDDPDHAIWQVVHGLVWRDTTFATISSVALENPDGPLNSAMLGETIVNGHVATQVLALRRLTDRTKGVMSLQRLIEDVKRNRHLLTRENYVCFDGLPYDYAAVRNEVWADRRSGVVYWGDTTGPKAYGTSELLHAQFDRLAGVKPADRTRTDTFPLSLLSKVENWLLKSGAEEIAQWSHGYLAHAGNAEKRKAIAHIQLTNDKISAAIRDIARVTEALSAEILGIGGRMNALMPVAQYDVLDRLEKPVALMRQFESASATWEKKSQEWDAALSDVRDALSSGA